MTSIREIVEAKGAGSPPPIEATGLSDKAKSYLPALRGVVRSQHQNRVLVVGLMPSNLGEWALHPQIIVWSSQEEYWHSSSIPVTVGAILIARFISHSQSTRISGAAKARGLLYGAVLQTGEIRGLLDEAFQGIGAPAKPKEPQMAIQPSRQVEVVARAPLTTSTSSRAVSPPPVVDAPKPKRGGASKSKGITDVVRRLADLKGSPKAEGERLYPLLKDRFPNTTATKIIAIISNIRLSAGLTKGSTRRFGGRGGSRLATEVKVAAHPMQDMMAQAVVTPPAPPTTVPVRLETGAVGDATIAEALACVARASAALATAEAILQHVQQTQQEEYIRAVEDGVMEALANATAKFRQPKT